MPYITHSRNSPELLGACSIVGKLFSHSAVVGRGVKPLTKVITDARSKGFKKIIILGRSGKGPMYARLITTYDAANRYATASSYTLSKSGRSITIKNKSGVGDGSKSITTEAEDSEE